MSNQPEQPQPYPGTPQDYTPPGYMAAPTPPPVYGEPPADFPGQNPPFQNSQAPSPQPYGAFPPDQFGRPPFAAPTYYQGGPGYVDNTSGPRGMSLASMIIGLSSLFVVGWFIVPQIVGIILGHIGLSKESPQGKPFSITGLVTNYLALLVYGGLYFFFIIAFAAWGAESYSPSSETYTWLKSGL